MLLILGQLLDRIFGSTATTVLHAAEAKLRRETVGRAEASMSGAESRMRQRALRSLDNIGPNRRTNQGSTNRGSTNQGSSNEGGTNQGGTNQGCTNQGGTDG